MSTGRAPRWLRAAVGLVLAATLTACSDQPADRGPQDTPSPSATALTAPEQTWPTARPEDLGLDPRVLERTATAARTAGSKCFLVVRDGRIAGEWYFDGTDPRTPHPVFSVTKSVTSTLVGIAQDEGALDVGDPAAAWIPSWQDTPSQDVTVRNLLANDSGREWALALDYSQLVGSRDMTGFAVGLRQAARPGSTWAYNNSAIQTLEAVLESATGQDVAAYARDRLFAPLGMDDTHMSHDAAGNTMTYSGITSTCRDLARFGVLMLEGGRWGEEQIVSRAWVRAATGRPSTKLNAAYGYLWWTNHAGRVRGPLPDAAGPRQNPEPAPAAKRGRLVPGAPRDVFWAIGLGSQIVQVDPRSGTVVVRLGEIVRRETPPAFGPADTARVVTDGVRPGKPSR